MDSRAIGVFDSGLGGLTVVKEIIKVLPKENIVYLGDTARVPYGTRSGDIVKKFSFQDANFLRKKNVKCIVIACNTSSAHASAELKSKLQIPVFEVIAPAAKRGSRVSKNKRIGVIGTRGTISSGAYQKEIKKINPETKVFAIHCPLFVPFIEEAEFGPALDKIIDGYLELMKKARVDTLILGCTHYPIIEKQLRKYLGAKVKFINPGCEVARDLVEFLKKKDMLSSKNSVSRNYFVTDLTERFVKVAEMFLGEKIKEKIKEVDIEK